MTNWSVYDCGLAGRGGIRFSIDENVFADWRDPWRKSPGGERRSSNTAIAAALTLGTVACLPRRQTEGFACSLFVLMGAEVPVPDPATLARRRRTVAVDMHASAQSKQTDIVLDSTVNLPGFP